MVHQSETNRRLKIETFQPQDAKEFFNLTHGHKGVCLIRLPFHMSNRKNLYWADAGTLIDQLSRQLLKSAVVIVFGDVADLVHVHQDISKRLHYHLWIAIKREPIEFSSSTTFLPRQHVGAVVYTKYEGHLQHTKTRLEYTYCPACNKTTKDYGGKKHTYHHYGTLISDVWRDITVDPQVDIEAMTERFADLFGLPTYETLSVYDLSKVVTEERRVESLPIQAQSSYQVGLNNSMLINGDCLTELRKLPSNSIDFAFADPPYNLKKAYRGYADDLRIQDYFEWCDAWISEIARLLRPGGTFALLNIPLWSIRHYLHLETVLQFQNWIAWDALSFPVRMIMPAHYTILCFSKGDPRPLPGLEAKHRMEQFLTPMAEGYCLRQQCVSRRLRAGVDDRGSLSDIWWDIHRLKHNARRVDHPCQLPPQLLYRLISIFTEPDEIVLDCFNGAGTTTLTAQQLGRRYVGIEMEPQYYQLAVARHAELEQGIDPFRKEVRTLTAKNSPVARVKAQKYEIPKKTLQLEVRRVAQQLGHVPTREEMIEHGQYPIHYYDEYFVNWGEVCAAARTTGMRETREDYPEATFSQLRLF